MPIYFLLNINILLKHSQIKKGLCEIKIGERLYTNVQYKKIKKRDYKNTK